MRKIATLLTAAVPLVAWSQTAAPPLQPADPTPPPPQYTPPPPQQYAPPPAQQAPPAQQGAPQQAPQYAPPPQYPPPAQYAPPQPAPQPQYAPPARGYGPMHVRDSWYIGFGLGGGDGTLARGGSSVSFKEYLGSSSSPTTAFVNFKVGATLSPRLLLGFDVTGVRSAVSESGVDVAAQITNYDVALTFFPMATGPFVRAGAGIARFNWDASASGRSASGSTSGANLLLGAGYAFWLGTKFNLTVNLDYSAASYGTQSDIPALLPESSSFWAIWLGCDWY